MRADLGTLLRGLVKFVAVVLAAALAGLGIGAALAKLSGNDASDAASVTPTTERPATSTIQARPGTTSADVKILSAQIGPRSKSTGRALVAVRARVTNRGDIALVLEPPVLVFGGEEVALGSRTRDSAAPLLLPIAPGSSATAVLRFVAPSEVARRLKDKPVARLRVANRTTTVNLTETETR